MPDPIYPGAVWDSGVNAGYRAGRTRMDVAVCHYTVGVNSAPIGAQGYFHWLIGRDGTVTQFAEADALTWHAGEWNVYGPGIEVEYYAPNDGDVIFTDAARSACAGLIGWLNSEWAIPLDYYDGPRQSTSDQRGFMSHRSLVQTEQHYDYWPQADWDAMTNGGFLMALTPDQQYAVYLYLAHQDTGTWENGRTEPTLLDKTLADVQARLAKLEAAAAASKPISVSGKAAKPGQIETYVGKVG